MHEIKLISEKRSIYGDTETLVVNAVDFGRTTRKINAKVI